ncbi:Helix-turn-helix [Blastococcus fimeti]|nr:Helix-turn-helix [Blastococcus fimeti]
MPRDQRDGSVDVTGLVRRIRRIADLSQRELAARLRLSKSTVAAIEAGTRDVDVRVLAEAAALAGLRLALLDAKGGEAPGMHPGAVRDRGGRFFPAHLDTVLSEERASRWEHRPRLRQPNYTFDRRSPWEDAGNRAAARPADHLLPQPGDSPQELRAARQAAARQRRQEEWERRLAAGELPPPATSFSCTCPAGCDELDDWSGRPVHVEDCPCSCDVG